MLAHRLQSSEPSLYPLETNLDSKLLTYTGFPLVLTSAITASAWLTR
jgi:hypothetical protein